MKKILFILVVILLSTSVTAQSYNRNRELVIDFDFDSEFDLTGSGTLNRLFAQVYLIPMDDAFQEVISINEFSTPLADSDVGEFMVFTWDEKVSNYKFGYNSVIRTNNVVPQMGEVEFPYPDIPEEYNNYLNEKEIIDITPEIIEKASEIVGNEDDAYLAVHKIASWVYANIEYDLNSYTADASKPASWVLENKQGVCDEITSLFIAMTRSIGIPARFISGVAYTNLDENFGNHGWAEVYYSGHGWIPYDVTFDQFGWIDPTHIALQKSADAGESSITYQWESSGDIDLDSKDIITTAQITSQGDEIENLFDVTITALKNNVAPGSYVPVKVTIENPYDSYISDQITITKAPELTERNQKVAALKPKETKDIFWIVQLPDDTQEGYIYTATIEAKDTFNSVDSVEITFSDDDSSDFISLEDAEEIVDSLNEEDDNDYSNLVVMSCRPLKSYYYSFEMAKIDCSVRSVNNNLNNLELCLAEQCETFSLTKNSEKKISFEMPPTNNLITTTLKNNEVDIKRVTSIVYLEQPEIKISNVNITSVNYGEEINVPLTLFSYSPLKNVILNINRFNKLEVGDLEDKKSYVLKLNTKTLSSGKISFDLEFEDEYGNNYKQRYEKKITVNNLPWYWKFINLFRS
jgi:hypothetical protein